MKEWIIKYKTQLLYLLFGGATTLINILAYSLCYYQFSINNTASNIISWIVSVLFAYITNKIWVFDNKTCQASALLKEFSSFVFCRILTGALDLLIMHLSVDVYHLVAWHFKIISNIIVIICNYVASKVIFSKKENNQ